MAHKSVTLIQLSFQTIDEESFKLRGSKMPFDEYMNLLEKIIFNKKRIASNCKININVMNDYHCHSDKLWGIFHPEQFWKFMNKVEQWKQTLLSENAMEKSDRKSHVGKYYYENATDIPKDFYNRSDEIHYEITPNLAVFVKHVGKFGIPDTFVDYLNKRKNNQYIIKNKPMPIPPSHALLGCTDSLCVIKRRNNLLLRGY